MPPHSPATGRDETQTGLRAAYELGRSAMASRVSMLDLAQIHHEVLLAMLNTATSSQEVRDLGRAAATFLVEALASFEMTQRAYMEQTSDSTPQPTREKNASPPA